jgi:Family of unknown function (DUF6001)
MTAMSAMQTLSPARAQPWPATVANKSLAEFRLTASAAFLETRLTSFARLREVIGRQVDGIAHLLLTSSPVHGLANATSDIDTICVVDGPDSLAERTATQIFDQSNHYETITFTRSEIISELNRLAAVVTNPPAAQVTAYQRWDRGGPLTRKYLERLVNGVGTDGSLPYFDRLPALAELWRAASLARALVAAECAALAERANEFRAAQGYVVNSLLYGMDALMSHHGHVFSNKKWFLLRFERFLQSGALETDMAELATGFSELWQHVFGALRQGTPPPGFAAETHALLALMEQAFGLELGAQAAWVRAENIVHTPYLPGADAALHERMVSLIPPLSGFADTPFGSAAGIAPASAKGRLNAARTGLVTPRFGIEGPAS